MSWISWKTDTAWIEPSKQQTGVRRNETLVQCSEDQPSEIWFVVFRSVDSTVIADRRWVNSSFQKIRSVHKEQGILAMHWKWIKWETILSSRIISLSPLEGLIMLKLSNSSIGDEAMKYLSDGLADNRVKRIRLHRIRRSWSNCNTWQTLRTLHLSKNHIEANGIQYLAAALKINRVSQFSCFRWFGWIFAAWFDIRLSDLSISFTIRWTIVESNF